MWFLTNMPNYKGNLAIKSMNFTGAMQFKSFIAVD